MNPRTTRTCEPRTAPAPRGVSLPVLAPPAAGKIRPSRMSRCRAGVLIAVNVLMVAHFLQWYYGGRTITPIEPSEAMYTLERGELNMGFIFFSLALLATLLLGRFVCGWACHLVALQDLCAWMLKKIGIRPKPFKSRVLVFVPILAALYMFVFPSVYRLFLPAPRNAFPPLKLHLTTEDFWATFASAAVGVPFLFICGFVVVYFLGAKGFCTYACPYGGFFGLLDKFAPGRIRVNDDCEQCGHCTAVCTSNVKVHEEVRLYGMVVDPGCMKCMDCVSVCPNDALHFGFGMPQALAVPRKMDNRGRLTRTAPPRAYSLTRGEEVLAVLAFAAAFFALRGVYDSVPFLMALGCAGIAAYGALKLWHLARRTDVSVQTLVLKSGARLRSAAWPFVVVSAVVGGLIVHCGFIRWHEWTGRRVYDAIKVPEELVLGGADLSKLLTPEISGQVDEGWRHYRLCERHGLLANPDTRMKLAWFSLLRRNPQEALAHLDAAMAMQPRKLQAGTFMYRGCIRALLGRSDEARRDYAAALAIRADLTADLTRLGEAMAGNGRLNDAVAAWECVIAVRPEASDAQHDLAGALRELGRPEQAVTHYQAALVAAPNDADTHFQLGITLTKLGREQEAGVHFARAVELEPRYREFLEVTPPRK